MQPIPFRALMLGSPASIHDSLRCTLRGSTENSGDPRIFAIPTPKTHTGVGNALGGERIQTPKGRFIRTTVLDHVAPTARVAREEIVGPVLSIIRFKTVGEVIEIDNSTHYGLAAGIYTREYDTVIQAARRLRAGTVWINT
jgi:acyl-CoA reductase-like NAD-dependent aldehyde dehydrogenase